MADEKYTYFALYYPFEVARVRLPLGLPAGPKFGIATELCTTDFASVLARRFWEFVLLPSPHGQDLLLSIRLARTSRRRCSNMCQQ